MNGQFCAKVHQIMKVLIFNAHSDNFFIVLAVVTTPTQPNITRARKSIVSWYPGYQPMSNLAANFGWAKGTASHHLRINSQLLAGPMAQSATKVY